MVDDSTELGTAEAAVRVIAGLFALDYTVPVIVTDPLHPTIAAGQLLQIVGSLGDGALEVVNVEADTYDTTALSVIAIDSGGEPVNVTFSAGKILGVPVAGTEFAAMTATQVLTAILGTLNTDRTLGLDGSAALIQRTVAQQLALLFGALGNDRTIGLTGAGAIIQRTATEEKAFLLSGLTANYALVTNGSGVVTAVPITGKNELYLPASCWKPRTTNGCADLAWLESATNKHMTQYLAFDTTTQEHAQCSIWLPKGYNASTIIGGLPQWTAASGSGTVQWALQGRVFVNDDAIDQAFGTAVTSQDTLITALDFHEGPATSAMTPAGTLAKSRYCNLQIYRDVANDNLGVDALFIGWPIQVTTDAATDD